MYEYISIGLWLLIIGLGMGFILQSLRLAIVKKQSRIVKTQAAVVLKEVVSNKENILKPYQYAISSLENRLAYKGEVSSLDIAECKRIVSLMIGDYDPVTMIETAISPVRKIFAGTLDKFPDVKNDLEICEGTKRAIEESLKEINQLFQQYEKRAINI